MQQPMKACRNCGAFDWKPGKESLHLKTRPWTCGGCGCETAVATGDMICDVCGIQPVVAAQHTAPFEMIAFGTMDVLPRPRMWALCEPCAGFMGMRNVPGLTQRSLRASLAPVERMAKAKGRTVPDYITQSLTEKFYHIWTLVVENAQGQPFPIETN